MAVVTLPVVTNPQGAHLLDVNGNPISSADGGFPTTDRIRSLIMAGQGFRLTTGKVGLGAGGTAVGLEVVWNAITKNVLVYRAVSTAVASASDITLVHDNLTTQDAALTANLLTSIANLRTGSNITSLATAAWGTPANSTATATAGSPTLYERVGANTSEDMLINQSCIFIPVGQAARVIVYLVMSTAAGNGGNTLEWIEF